MRFAYIDSNGNEVPIPSVDALALRIELGAITEKTQLYDAQADQWGPAHTHEIYQSLARTAGGDGGFVAPPPVAPIPAPAPPPTTPESPEAKQAPAADAEEEAPEEVAGDVEGDTEDLGLTLAEAPATDEPSSGADDDLGADLGLTLADAPDDDAAEIDFGAGLSLADAPGAGESGLSPSLDATESSVPDDGPADEPGGFDFGDMAGGLELEETFEAPAVDEPLDLSGGFDAGGDAPDFSGGMELESPMDFSGGFDSGSDALDLEAPMSDFSPEAPPAWMAPGGDDEESGDVMDFSASVAGAGEGSEEDVPLRERRTPRNKPSAPKHRKQRNLAGPLVALVVLGAIGGGGYFAWPMINDFIASRGEPEVPEVVIPDIPTELLPQMQSVAQSTLTAVYGAVRTEWAGTSPVSAPPQDWLAGVYLANASQYEQAETFWEDMAELLVGMRGVDLSDFDAAYTAELARQGVAEADAAVMRERADSGFLAAAPAREEIFGRLDALIDAAIRLHQFLSANESNIEYVPASIRTTDPVLEVNPSTPVIGATMGDLLDAVTRGLGALNYRDAVTAQALWNTVLSEIQSSGLR